MYTYVNITSLRIHSKNLVKELANFWLTEKAPSSKTTFVFPGIPTTIKTMGVNITTIVYLRDLIIEIGSTIVLIVVEAQGFFRFVTSQPDGKTRNPFSNTAKVGELSLGLPKAKKVWGPDGRKGEPDMLRVVLFFGGCSVVSWESKGPIHPPNAIPSQEIAGLII